MTRCYPQPEQVSMTTRDGVRLDADLYLPEGEGPFPVLLMRQPYGRRIASTVTYAHPGWYAQQGYLVVIQDVRGRGTSEGEFYPFINELRDGEDTLEWLATLPGSNGRVGMYGFSYQGVTQLFAAASGHPALQVIAPAMTGFDLHRDWACEGGALRLTNSLCWAAQLGAETDRHDGNNDRFAQRYRLGHGPDASELIDPAAPSVRDLLRGTFYSDWLDSPAGSDYWAAHSPCSVLDSLSIPALHIGGWFDSFLTGTQSAYQHFAGSAACQRLVIGPWTHLPWTPQVGQQWLGDAANNTIDLLQLSWFDRFLKDDENGVDDEAPVQLFDLQQRQWREFDGYPQGDVLTLGLSTSGRAGMDLNDGKLVQTPQAHGTDVMIHDPWRPVPATGGHMAPSTGIHVRTAVDARPDVLTYTQAALDQPLQLAGDVCVTINAFADADSFDLCAVLSVVDANGVARNLTQGYLRTRGAGLHQIPLRGTCARIAPGESLRLSLSGSCFPAYTLNDGSGRSDGEVRATDHQIVTITVNTEGSMLMLPVQLEASQETGNE